MKSLSGLATAALMLTMAGGVSLADPPSVSERTPHSASAEELRALHESLVEALDLTQAQQRRLDSILLQLRHSHEPPARRAAAAANEPQVGPETEVELHIDIEGEALAESFQAYLEEFADRFEGQAEVLEAKLEALGERLEAWTGAFSAGWEEWADSHDDEWEAWSEKFAGQWEQWGQQLQRQHLEQQQVQEVIRGNLQLFSEMPLPELYDQTVASLRRIEEIPWDEIQGIETSLREAIVHAQDVMADMSREEMGLQAKARVAAESAAGQAAEARATANQRAKNVEALRRRLSRSAEDVAQDAVREARAAAEEDAVSVLRGEIQALRQEIDDIRAVTSFGRRRIRDVRTRFGCVSRDQNTSGRRSESPAACCSYRSKMVCNSSGKSSAYFDSPMYLLAIFSRKR